MSGIEYDFERDFDEFFAVAPAVPDVQDISGASSVAKEPRIEDETADWADIVIGTRKVLGPQIVAHDARSTQKPIRMPTVEATPRPSALLKPLTSHYLIFNASTFPAWIQCSHEPTLNFIAEYLTRHGKTNINDSLRVSH